MIKRIKYSLRYLICLPLMCTIMSITLFIGIFTPHRLPHWLDITYNSMVDFINPSEAV